jgi:MinD-like ATPase involved in chromosome partitioning or flagellar assembly
MTRVTICSAKGSPGVTTLSCVLGAVWPAHRGVVVAECDPAGGDLAGRFGLSTRLGMTSLILTERQQGGHLPDHRDHSQQLPGGLDVLIGPAGADSAMALDHELGVSDPDLVSAGCDLLADCGRLVPGARGQEKMIRAADHLLLLIRPDVTGIAHARWASSRIRDLSACETSALISGTGPFKPSEVAEELEIRVLGSMPFDPRAALIAGGAPGTAKEFIRSNLVAFGREVVGDLVGEKSRDESEESGKRRRTSQKHDREKRPRILERVRPAHESPPVRPDERPQAASL